MRRCVHWSPRLAARPLIATAALAFALALTCTAPAGADSAQESDLAARVNALRTSRGLNTLVVDQGISATARNWASQIAANGALSHNPNLANELPSNWTDMGENVVFGPDTATMERELENDPPHFANLTNPRFTHLGVGIVEVNGRLWGVQDFAGYGGAGPANAGNPYGQSLYAQPQYAQPSFAPAPAPAPAAAPGPATAPSTTASPAVGALAVSSPALVGPRSSDPPPATAHGAGTVAFTGGPLEDHVRWAAAALAVGLILLTTGGLVELKRPSGLRRL